MLILYAFFVLALSSFVIAAPCPSPPTPPPSPPPLILPVPIKPPMLLKGNQDDRLKGKWGRLKRPPVEMSHCNRWFYGMPCDDFLEVEVETLPEGISTTINVYRLEREVVDNGRCYSVRRSIHWENGQSFKGDAKLSKVSSCVPESEWGGFLHGTFWGREPDIIGESGLDSGPDVKSHGEVIYFETNVWGLHVTFYRRVDLPMLLGTINSYEICPGEPLEDDIYGRLIVGLGMPTEKRPSSR